jgi:hypothetical protein
MEKEFVPYSICLKMKVLGFNEPCLGYYENQNENLDISYSNIPLTKEQQKRPGLYEVDNSNNKLPQWATSAPTISQAFRWFEEKYKIYVCLKPVLGSKNGYDSFPILGWDFDIFSTNTDTDNSYYMGYPIGEWFTATLDRFEEGETLSFYHINPRTKKETEISALNELIQKLKQ